MSSLDLGSGLLRIALGVMILLHGWNKTKTKTALAGTSGWFSSIGMLKPALQARFASLSEIGAGVLLITGIFVPIAAGAVVAIMIVAIVVEHRSNGFFIFNEGQGWEYTAIVAIASLSLGALGGGKYSLDNAFNLHFTGLTGFVIAIILGVVGAGAQLAIFYRPSKKAQ